MKNLNIFVKNKNRLLILVRFLDITRHYAEICQLHGMVSRGSPPDQFEWVKSTNLVKCELDDSAEVLKCGRPYIGLII